MIEVLSGEKWTLNLLFFENFSEEEFFESLPEQENMNVVFIKDYQEIEIDYIIILGGDGSILWTLKKLHPSNISKQIIAINTGTVGFIC